MTLHFRPAASADLPFIIELLAIDSVGAPTDDPADAQDEAYQAALAAINADPNQELIVAELDGTPVGTFQLSYIPGLMR
ncbi:MAG TPA: GNAT family N-acetyltransferase, partial [Devosia sp.]|nr:GNAT family N-acetyltransferase [Devosia sp.]